MQPRIASGENARIESRQSARSNCKAAKVIERITHRTGDARVECARRVTPASVTGN